MGSAVLPSLLQNPLMILLKVKMKTRKVIMIMMVMKKVRKAMLLSPPQNPLIIKMMIPIEDEKIDLWNGEEVEAVGFKARHLKVEINFVEIKSKTGTPKLR